MEDPEILALIRRLGTAVSAAPATTVSESLSDIHHRIVSLIEQRDALAAVVDRLRFGVILAQHRSGAVLWTNRTAREIAARQSTTGRTPREEPTIHDLVANAIRDDAGIRSDGETNAAPQGRARAVASSGLQIVTLRSGRSGSLRSSTSDEPIAMCVAESRLCGYADVQMLRRLYSLTPSEARLTLLLTTGATIAQIARTIGISENTARWHLKHVLVKTGASTQAQAVRTVMGGLAALRFD